MRGQKVRIEVFRGLGFTPWYWRLIWANGRVAATSVPYEQHGTATVMAQKLARMLNVIVRQVPPPTATET